jgi:hypothetical protein
VAVGLVQLEQEYRCLRTPFPCEEHPGRNPLVGQALAEQIR